MPQLSILPPNPVQMPGVGQGSLGYDLIENYHNTFNQLIDEQRAYNQLQMDREDSAYQRMVEDMRKAGLNPWTGISSGGLSSSSLQPAGKSGLDSLLNIFTYNLASRQGESNGMIGAIKTGAQIALGIAGLFM